MENFNINDNNRVLHINYEPISSMQWVFLTEKLIGILANCDDELAILLRNATGLDNVSVKDTEITTKLIKGLLKAVSSLSDDEKLEIYDRILKGFSLKTHEGGVVYLTCNTLDSLIKKPTNFYMIIFNCLRCHYEDFFLEIREKLNTLQNAEKTNIDS